MSEASDWGQWTCIILQRLIPIRSALGLHHLHYIQIMNKLWCTESACLEEWLHQKWQTPGSCLLEFCRLPVEAVCKVSRAGRLVMTWQAHPRPCWMERSGMTSAMFARRDLLTTFVALKAKRIDCWAWCESEHMASSHVRSWADWLYDKQVVTATVDHFVGSLTPW